MHQASNLGDSVSNFSARPERPVLLMLADASALCRYASYDEALDAEGYCIFPSACFRPAALLVELLYLQSRNAHKGITLD